MHDIEKSTKEQFAIRIAEISSTNNLDIIESITSFCADNLLEIEDVLHLLDKSMKDKIKVAALEKRCLKGVKQPKALDTYE